MSNHLDLVLQSTDFQISGDLGLHFAARKLEAVGSQVRSDKSSVKAALAQYPVEHGADITGRWRPRWSDDGADLTN